MTLGQQIKTLRVEKNLSQPELANAIGIEQSYLSKLENDKSTPSNDIFRKLLVGLDISIEELIKPMNSAYIKSHLIQIPDIDNWYRAKFKVSRRFSTKLIFIDMRAIPHSHPAVMRFWQQDHYTWIYSQIDVRGEEIADVLQRHGLL